MVMLLGANKRFGGNSTWAGACRVARLGFCETESGE